jgi:hypothetical protein
MDMWGHNPFVVYPPRKVPEKWKVSDIYRLSELQEAIDHYFGKPDHKKPVPEGPKGSSGAAAAGRLEEAGL